MFYAPSFILWREGPLHKDHLCFYVHHKSNLIAIMNMIFDGSEKMQPPIVWFPGDPDCGEGDLGGEEDGFGNRL